MFLQRRCVETYNSRHSFLRDLENGYSFSASGFPPPLDPLYEPVYRWPLTCKKSRRSFLGFPRCCPLTGLTDNKSSVSRVPAKKSARNSNRAAEENCPNVALHGKSFHAKVMS